MFHPRDDLHRKHSTHECVPSHANKKKGFIEKAVTYRPKKFQLISLNLGYKCLILLNMAFANGRRNENFSERY